MAAADSWGFLPKWLFQKKFLKLFFCKSFFSDAASGIKQLFKFIFFIVILTNYTKRKMIRHTKSKIFLKFLKNIIFGRFAMECSTSDIGYFNILNLRIVRPQVFRNSLFTLNLIQCLKPCQFVIPRKSLNLTISFFFKLRKKNWVKNLWL